MVLRASAEIQGIAVELGGLTDPSSTTGLPGGDTLIEFADALLGRDERRLDKARDAVIALGGKDGLFAASIIAGNFTRNDRIANAIGIPLEKDFVDQSADFREALGINRFPSAVNSLG